MMGEYCGNQEFQHLILYPETTILWFGISENDSASNCLSLKVSNDLFKKYEFNTVQCKQLGIYRLHDAFIYWLAPSRTSTKLSLCATVMYHQAASRNSMRDRFCISRTWIRYIFFQHHWSRGKLYPCARSRRWSIESSGNWGRNCEATSKVIRIRWSWSPISRRKLSSFVNTSHPTNLLRVILLLLSMPSRSLNPTPTIGIESYIILQKASEFINNLLHSYKSW